MARLKLENSPNFETDVTIVMLWINGLFSLFLLIVSIHCIHLLIKNRRKKYFEARHYQLTLGLIILSGVICSLFSIFESGWIIFGYNAIWIWRNNSSSMSVIYEYLLSIRIWSWIIILQLCTIRLWFLFYDIHYNMALSDKKWISKLHPSIFSINDYTPTNLSISTIRRHTTTTTTTTTTMTNATTNTNSSTFSNGTNSRSRSTTARSQTHDATFEFYNKSNINMTTHGAAILRSRSTSRADGNNNNTNNNYNNNNNNNNEDSIVINGDNGDQDNNDNNEDDDDVVDEDLDNAIAFANIPTEVIEAETEAEVEADLDGETNGEAWTEAVGVDEREQEQELGEEKSKLDDRGISAGVYLDIFKGKGHRPTVSMGTDATLTATVDDRDNDNDSSNFILNIKPIGWHRNRHSVTSIASLTSVTSATTTAPVPTTVNKTETNNKNETDHSDGGIPIAGLTPPMVPIQPITLIAPAGQEQPKQNQIGDKNIQTITITPPLISAPDGNVSNVNVLNLNDQEDGDDKTIGHADDHTDSRVEEHGNDDALERQTTLSRSTSIPKSVINIDVDVNSVNSVNLSASGNEMHTTLQLVSKSTTDDYQQRRRMYLGKNFWIYHIDSYGNTHWIFIRASALSIITLILIELGLFLSNSKLLGSPKIAVMIFSFILWLITMICYFGIIVYIYKKLPSIYDSWHIKNELTKHFVTIIFVAVLLIVAMIITVASNFKFDIIASWNTCWILYTVNNIGIARIVYYSVYYVLKKCHDDGKKYDNNDEPKCECACLGRQINSRSVVKKNKTKLAQFMDDHVKTWSVLVSETKHGYKMFMRFLVDEFSAENLLLYVHVLHIIVYVFFF